MQNYYLINGSLDVIPLGEHPDYDSAQQVAESLDDASDGTRAVLCITTEEGIEHLKSELAALK